MVDLCTHDDVSVMVLMVFGGGTGLMLVIRILINYYRHSYDRQHFSNDTC